MIDEIGIFAYLILGVALIVGLLAKYIFKKTHIPDVLFLLSLGMVFSYFGLATDVNHQSPLLELIIMFALIYIVFNGGLPIRLKAVFSHAKWVLISAVLNILAITALVFILSLLIGLTVTEGLVLGILLCVVDGSIVNSILEIVKLSRRAEAFIQMESALIDIFVIVVLISMQNFTEVGFSDIFQQFMLFLFLSSAIGGGLALIWMFVLKKLEGMKHLSITTLTVLLLVFFLAEYSQANGVIAVFVFSIVLGNARVLRPMFYKEDARSMGAFNRIQKRFFDDFTFFLRTLLFVYMGTLIHFEQWPYLLLGLVFVVGAFIYRSFIYRAIKTPYIPAKDKHIMEAMGTKGLTPIVMVSLLAGNPVITNTVIGSIIFSVIISSVMIALIQKRKFSSIATAFLGPEPKRRRSRKRKSSSRSSRSSGSSRSKSKTRRGSRGSRGARRR